MIYLLLSVLCSVGIFVSFKIGRKLNISTLSLITINYYVATIFGFDQLLRHEGKFHLSYLSGGSVAITVLIGVLFVLMFYIAGRSVDQAGMAVSTAASKLSVVFPFFFSLLIDPADKSAFSKFLSIFLILISIVLISYSSSGRGLKYRASLFPILLFFGMGVVDSLVKLAQQVYIIDKLEAYFSTGVFFCAVLASTVWFLSRGNSFKKLNIPAFLLGIFLGLVNFGSLYFFIKALNANEFSGEIGSSSVFVLNNIGIIIMASFLGLALFREKLTCLNIAGLILSVVGIVILLYN